MEKLKYDNGNITIDKNTLYFYGEVLNFSIIESASLSYLPRRSIFTGLKLWLYGLIVMVIVCNIWRNLVILGDLYIYSLAVLVIFNIVCFLKKYYLLTVRTKSGKEYYTKGRDKYLIQEIVDVINSKIEIVSGKNDKNVIINNGIINEGNNNINKMEGKKRW